MKPRDTLVDLLPGFAFPSRGLTSTGRVGPGSTCVGSINEPPKHADPNIGRGLCACPLPEELNGRSTCSDGEPGRAPYTESGRG